MRHCSGDAPDQSVSGESLHGYGIGARLTRAECVGASSGPSGSVALPTTAISDTQVTSGRLTSDRRQIRLRVIGCEVLARPLYACAPRSPHIVDISLLRRGLHDTPATLRESLQLEIDAAGEAQCSYDAIVLAYGLCGGATEGIAATNVPLVLPRAHDCITLFLGSRHRYQREFTAHPGTYWYVADYMERSEVDRSAATSGLLGIGASSDDDLQLAYAEYVARFGKDNADYLMEAMGAWRAHYDRAVFVEMDVGDGAHWEARARAEAEERCWRFERRSGDLLLLRRLLDGDWADDFLVLQPGQRLAMSYDDGVICAAQMVGVPRP